MKATKTQLSVIVKMGKRKPTSMEITIDVPKAEAEKRFRSLLRKTEQLFRSEIIKPIDSIE
jgi:hypothetical protein